MKAFSLACTLAVATSGLHLQEDEADIADAPIEDVVEVIEVEAEVEDEAEDEEEHSLYT